MWLQISNPIPIDNVASQANFGADTAQMGLAGLAERVKLSGGTFAAGPRSGLFVVDVELPVAASKRKWPTNKQCRKKRRNTVTEQVTRIVVADDEALLRQGLVLMLDGAEGSRSWGGQQRQGGRGGCAARATGCGADGHTHAGDDRDRSGRRLA